MGKVKAFIGEKSSLLAVYNGIKGEVAVDIYCREGISELKVEVEDYVKALALGSEFIRKSGVNHTAWISPCGAPNARYNEVSVSTAKNLKKGIMLAFSSDSATEINRVANRLDEINISAVASCDERGNWQLAVNQEDYFEAVAIGSKFVDGCGLKRVIWNDPTGGCRFDIATLAATARTDLDDVLEA